MRSIHQKILEQIRSGSRAALVTVVRVSGSTPQKAGSSALFGERGLLAGTVGGGLLEGEVQHITESVIISGASDHFYFNLDSDPEEDGAICGGEAEVLIDASPSDHLAVLEKMEESLIRQQDGYLLSGVSRLHDNGRSIRRHWIPAGSHKDLLPPDMDPAFKKVIIDHLKQAKRHGFTEIDLSQVSHQVERAYLEHIRPMPHLIIAGAGHIGKALAHLGSVLEFAVTVVDDRPEFANAVQIPDADHKHDGEALKSCIGSEAAYIGMIGSLHKVGILRKRFLEKGWASQEQWASIHAPIGLDIGSVTVQEIAISIAAQLVEVRRQKIMANDE
jgi:xanthine dehydrogenase accessory factor